MNQDKNISDEKVTAMIFEAASNFGGSIDLKEFKSISLHKEAKLPATNIIQLVEDNFETKLQVWVDNHVFIIYGYVFCHT